MAQYTSISGLKLLLLVLSFGFFAYILGPQLYWHFVGEGSHGSCAPCITECPEDVVTKAAIAGKRSTPSPIRICLFVCSDLLRRIRLFEALVHWHCIVHEVFVD